MDPFLSEIRLFTYDFPMTGWANCDGTILPAQQNSALFVQLGAAFGGNGTTTFGLPDMRSRLPVCSGEFATGTTYQRGESSGRETVTLALNQVPTHNHVVYASTDTTTLSPQVAGSYLGNAGQAASDNNAPNNLYTTEYVPAQLSPNAVAPGGGGQPHNNCMPSLALKFCIATLGVWPNRN